MKKAKLMLSALVVIAAVGGAFAFKAAKFGLGNVYCKINNVCTPKDLTTVKPFDTAPRVQDPCQGETILFTAAGCPDNASTTTTGISVYDTDQ